MKTAFGRPLLQQDREYTARLQDHLTSCKMSSKCVDGHSSPAISRKDPISFTIPQAYHSSPITKRIRGGTELQARTPPQSRKLCPRARAKSYDDVGCNLTHPNIGNVCIELWYSRDDELLMIRLVRVDLLATPNPAAIGSKWDVRPVVKVCLQHKKRSFWHGGQSKANCSLVPHDTRYLPIKRDAVQNECLRLAVFDERRYNEKIPIGFVFVRLVEIDLSWKSSAYVREIAPSSELTGFNTGRVEVTLKWDSPSEKLRLRILSAKGIMSPHGTLGRSFFTRTFVFVSGVEVKHLKSITHHANPNVQFDIDYAIALTSHEIIESFILIQLYAKSRERLSFTPELIGSTIIGPYMPKGLNSFTHWENMIANPMEEITESHDLYL